MQGSLNRFKTRLTMATALALGALPSFIPGVKKPREIDFTSKKPRQSTPFSSARQEARYKRQGLHMALGLNGHETMQQSPSWMRKG